MAAARKINARPEAGPPLALHEPAPDPAEVEALRRKLAAARGQLARREAAMESERALAESTRAGRLARSIDAAAEAFARTPGGGRPTTPFVRGEVARAHALAGRLDAGIGGRGALAAFEAAIRAILEETAGPDPGWTAEVASCLAGAAGAASNE